MKAARWFPAILVIVLIACQPVKKSPPTESACSPISAEPPCPPPPGSPKLHQALVVGDLETPWDIAFVPGTGELLYTEKRAGRLSRLLPNGKDEIGSVPVHDVNPAASEGDVAPQHAGHVEAGLLGVAVHPDFEVNSPAKRWVYLCFTTDSDVRVQQYAVDTANPDNWTMVPTDKLLAGIPFGQIHHGCRIRFQPGTTNLFVTTGDATIATAAQDPNSLGGKVLRVDENLDAVPGNPWNPPNPPNGDPRIYTFGHRNVQGIAFAPDGRIYTTEHGPDRDDEVNILKAGANYGWDPDGGNDQYNQQVPMTFPGATPAAWSSGLPTIAPSGAAILRGPAWGSWDGALAVAFLKARRLGIMFRGPDGTIRSTWFETSIAKGSRIRPPRLRGATLGPDGNLYIATDAPVPAQGDNFPGEIWRITPT